MSKTINGKPYAEALKALQAPFQEESFSILESFNQTYIPCEEIQNRFDSVLGVFGYDFTCSELQLIQNGSQQNFIVIGTLTIKNDDGETVVSRSCPGGCTIIYPTNSDTPSKVSNNAETVAKDSFKRCAKMFGVGSDQLREIRKEKKKKNTTKSMEDSLMKAEIVSSFSTNSKGGYIATVKVDGESMQLIIWKDAQEIIKQTLPMEKFVESYKPGKILTFYGRLSSYGNKPQVILTNVSKK